MRYFSLDQIIIAVPSSMANLKESVTCSDLQTYTKHPVRLLQCNLSREPS